MSFEYDIGLERENNWSNSAIWIVPERSPEEGFIFSFELSLLLSFINLYIIAAFFEFFAGSTVTGLIGVFGELISRELIVCVIIVLKFLRVIVSDVLVFLLVSILTSSEHTLDLISSEISHQSFLVLIENTVGWKSINLSISQTEKNKTY